jgi:hypothetical protein
MPTETMPTAIILPLDGPEAHVVSAALTLYEALLANATEAGGDAADVAALMGPIAERVGRRLALLMYPPDLALGDHYLYVDQLS